MAKSKDTSQPPGGDERNVVPASESGLTDIETRLAVFWEKYQKLVLGGIAAILVLFLAVRLYQFIDERAEAARQKAYAELADTEAKLAWAEENAGHPLAGLAFKELADEAYAQERHDDSARLYAQAAASARSSLAEAAKFGQAMALLEQEKSDEARAILERLADDERAGNQQQAKYQLARLAIDEGRYEEARSHLREIVQVPRGFYWMQKAMELQQRLPRQEGAASD